MVHRIAHPTSLREQRGKAAEESLNVFYYLTYEGAADLDALDPAMRAAVSAHIPNPDRTPPSHTPSHPARPPFNPPYPPPGNQKALPRKLRLPWIVRGRPRL